MLWSRGLVGSWPLENTALDASGNGHNGTLEGGASFADGQFGRCVNFPGSYGDRITFGNVNLVDLATKATFAIRFLEAGSREVNRVLFFNRYGGTQVGIRKKSASDMYIYSGADYIAHVTNELLYSADTWNSLILVFNGTLSGNENRLRIYLNTVDVGFASFSPYGVPDTIPNDYGGNNWMVGDWAILAGYSWYGKLDDFAVWNGLAAGPSDVKRIAMGMHPIG